MCEDGYYGDPLGQSGATRPCERCKCNGNVDPNALGVCDHISGRCLKCLGHTEGQHCERCQRGFYGDALHPTTSKKCKRERRRALPIFFFFFLSFLGRMCRHHYLNPFDGDNYASTSLEWYHTLPISGPGERYKRALRLLQFTAIQIISRTATLASCFRSFSCTLTSFLPFHTISIRTLLDSHHHPS